MNVIRSATFHLLHATAFGLLLAAWPPSQADPLPPAKTASHALGSTRLRAGGPADAPGATSTDNTTITTSAGPGKSPLTKGGAASMSSKAPESLPCRPTKRKPPPPGYCGS